MWSAAASGKSTEAVQHSLSKTLQQVSSLACNAALQEHASPETHQKLQQAANDISAVQQLSSSGAAGASSVIVGAFARALGSLGQCVEALHKEFGEKIVSLKVNMQQMQEHHEEQLEQLKLNMQQMQEHHEQNMQQMQEHHEQQLEQLQQHHEAAIVTAVTPLQETLAHSDIMRKYGEWVALFFEQVARGLGDISWTDLSMRLRHESQDHQHLKWTKGQWHKHLLEILSEMTLDKNDWTLLRSFAHERNTGAHYQALQKAADGESEQGPHLTEEDLQGINMLSPEFDPYKPSLRKAVAVVAQSYGWKS